MDFSACEVAAQVREELSLRVVGAHPTGMGSRDADCHRARRTALVAPKKLHEFDRSAGVQSSCNSSVDWLCTRLLRS